MNRCARKGRRGFVGIGRPERLEDRRVPATLTVVTADDSGPGSLRQAILDANASAGADRIAFDIPGAGVHTIRLVTDLPTITDPLAIDGTTQPGAKANDLAAGDDAVFLIELDGSLVPAASNGGNGLFVAAGESSVRGLVINRFPGAGIRVGGEAGMGLLEGTPPAGVSIAGNRIGTDAAGAIALGGGGIYVSRASDVTIGGTAPGDGNLLSGNIGSGIVVGTDDYPTFGSFARPDGFVIQGNRIGTDAAGAAALGNTGDGILLNGVNDATIGGTAPGAGNVIAANGLSGIDVEPSRIFTARGGFSFVGSNGGLVIRGNAIGTDRAGTAALGNAGDGVVLVATDRASVGGPAAGAGNVIAANRGAGVRLGMVSLVLPGFSYTNVTPATKTLIQGNAIGTDRAGTAALGNGGVGLDLRQGSGTTYGGGVAAAANAIANNGGRAILAAPVMTNYDGLTRANLAVYLPDFGAFAYRPTNTFNPDQVVPFGLPGAGQTVPTLGDFDGDGVADLAAYLPTLGLFAYRPSTGGPDVLQPFGLAGPGRSIPAPGDFSGSGRSDVAIYLPDFGAFAIRPAAGGPDRIVPFGFAGAGQTVPAVGDYYGTGQDDIAAYLPALGAFAIRNPAGGDAIVPFGLPGPGLSIPAPGDYDGDGKTDLAVYLPTLGLFAYRPSGGGADVIQAFGSPGLAAIPVPGDYSGAGKTEVALFFPAFGAFAYRPADGSGGGDVIVAFGSAGPGNSIPPAALPGPPPPSATAAARSVAPGPAARARVSAASAVPAGPALVARRLARPAVTRDTPRPGSDPG